jgi:hypothetical protein
MKRLFLSLSLFATLAACNMTTAGGQRTALANQDLHNYFSGTTITLIPEDPEALVEQAIIHLYTDGTSRLILEDVMKDGRWRIDGQDLCFDREDGPTLPSDCRTIGWIDGNQFAVYDLRYGEQERIATGTIRRH